MGYDDFKRYRDDHCPFNWLDIDSISNRLTEIEFKQKYNLRQFDTFQK